MSDDSDVPRLHRGEVMRQIAALHARLATSFRDDGLPRLSDDRRRETLRQIAALEKKLMDS
jgi:hypothetical protein